jgi:hypothetical protein
MNQWDKEAVQCRMLAGEQPSCTTPSMTLPVIL